MNVPCVVRARIIGGVTNLLAIDGEWAIRVAVAAAGGGGGGGFAVCANVGGGGMTPLMSLGGTFAGVPGGSTFGDGGGG